MAGRTGKPQNLETMKTVGNLNPAITEDFGSE